MYHLVVHTGIEDVELTFHALAHLFGAVHLACLFQLLVAVVVGILDGDGNGGARLIDMLVDDYTLIFVVVVLVYYIEFVDIYDFLVLLVVFLVLCETNGGEQKKSGYNEG